MCGARFRPCWRATVSSGPRKSGGGASPQRSRADDGEVYGAIAASLTGVSNGTPMRHRPGGALVRMHLRAAQ